MSPKTEGEAAGERREDKAPAAAAPNGPTGSGAAPPEAPVDEPAAPGVDPARAPMPSSLSSSFATLLGSGPGEPRPPGAPETLTPGSKFGVYLVGRCIGEGGMARIYQAEHAGLRRQVALKVLIDGFARDPDGRERFLREARIAAAIKHPNVVNIFDVGVQDDVPYLVMELLEGRDLEKLLEPRRPLDEQLIVDIMVPVLAGLIAVHDAGVVHRDLKPANIFLAQGRYNDLEPKLLDFGISKSVGPDQLRLTVHRTLMGTPFYISPEALRGSEVTPLSDQYSLGVVMYECATGVPPFTAMNFTELSTRISSGEYVPVNTHNPELSKRLARIVERAMSREPESRYRDLREMGRELLVLAGQRTRITWGLSFGEAQATLASGRAAYAAGVSAPPPGHSRDRRGSAFRRAALVASASLAIAGLGGWWAFGSSVKSAFRASTHTPSTHSPPPVETARPAISAAAAAAAPPAVAAPVSSARPSNEASPDGAAPAKRSAPPVHDVRPASHPQEVVSAAMRSRSTAPAARRPAKSPSEPDAEWALPSSTSSPPASRSPGDAPNVTANGAPIFD